MCFDLQYLLAPSTASAKRLLHYYQLILTPRPAMLSPGYYFPLFIIHQLCVACPSIHNYWTLALWLPISYRYYFLLKQCTVDERNLQQNHAKVLQHWWTVVVLRLGLYYINYSNLQASSCYGGGSDGNDSNILIHPSEWMSSIHRYLMGLAGLAAT